MITTTLLPTFPGCPTYGFTSQPDYLVKIVTREGGYEKRDRKWQQALHRYEGMPMGERPQRDIEAIAEFFHGVGAQTHKFRFLDYADFKSCRLDDDASALDQPFITGPGSPGAYQLVKVYPASPARTTTRVITQPNGGTIRVANEASIEQAAGTWTIEEDTGLLVPGPGFAGVPTSWGGEFFVPCRFDGPLRVEISNFEIQSLACSLIEVRPEP